jgi:nicotinate-nucleotide adenylyltransferase
MNKRRIGIYPGTFDPVHQGHIALAQEAMRTLSLDEVVLLPEPRPRGKDAVTSLEHRVAMLEAAVATEQGIRVVQPLSEQFTVQETLPELEKLCGDAAVFLLMGSDVACTLPYWEKCGQLVRAVSFVVGMRTTSTREAVREAMSTLEAVSGVPVQYTCLETTQSSVASSYLRTAPQGGHHLHPHVLSYIQTHSLYP